MQSQLSEGRNREDSSSKPAQAKSWQESISMNKKMGVVAHTCYPSHVGDINRRIAVRTSWP
jgi:hypothetical protein